MGGWDSTFRKAGFTGRGAASLSLVSEAAPMSTLNSRVRCHKISANDGDDDYDWNAYSDNDQVSKRIEFYIVSIFFHEIPRLLA